MRLSQRLYKAGILAKVEAEQRALRVVRLQAELTKAQLAELQKSTAGMSNSMVSIDSRPLPGENETRA